MYQKSNIIVVGAGMGGICSAIAASRTGAKVLLIEEKSFVGGTAIGAMVSPWMTFHVREKQIIKGIPQEIVDRLIINNGSPGHIKDTIGMVETITPFDIDILKKVIWELLFENNIDVLLNCRVIGCNRKNNKIESIIVSTLSGEKVIEADFFIDASGDGDLCALADVPFQIGGKNKVVQPMTLIFHMSNVDLSKIKEYIIKNPNQFVLGCNEKEILESKYLSVSGFFELVKKGKENNDFNVERDRVLFFAYPPKNYVTVNMTRISNYSPLEAIELSKAEREGILQTYEIANFLKKYIPGFEKSYLSRIATNIGIRESRHIKGRFILDKEHVTKFIKFDDKIAKGSYPIDIHSSDGSGIIIEKMNPSDYYEIPFGCIVPEGLSNVFISGRCISASHIAHASCRVTPIVMAIGQAAGVSAGICLKNKTNSDNIDIKDIQKELKNQGADI